MDEVLFDLSRSLLDDPPAGDPRWGRKGGKGKSALIENQIADKAHAFDILIQFLKVTGYFIMKISHSYSNSWHLEKNLFCSL